MEKNSITKSINESFPGLIPNDDNLLIFKALDKDLTDRSSVTKFISVHRGNNVEQLLKEAMMLLKRCMLLRKEKNEIEEKLISFWINHKRDEAKTKADRLRLESGEYEIENDINNLAINARNNVETLLENSSSIIKESLKYRDEDSTMAKDRIKVMGEFSEVLSQRDAEIVWRRSAEKEKVLLQYEKLSELKAQISNEIQQVLNSYLLKSADTKTAYLKKRINIRDDELSAEEEALHNWKIAVETAGLATNYVERLTEIQSLFDSDFGNAFGRCNAILEGLNKVYGRSSNPLPNLSEDKLLNKLVLWLRDAAEYLSIESKNHIMFSWSVDIVQLLNSVGGTIENGRIKFTLDKSALPQLDACLIRGLKVSVRGMEPGKFHTYLISHKSKHWDFKILIGDVTRYTENSNYGYANSGLIENVSLFGDWEIDGGNQLEDALNNEGNVLVDFKLVGYWR